MKESKVAFCFPGQGSLEQGMGRDIAEVVPEAMRVFELGSAASGLDLKALCFDSHVNELVETEVQQPALVATSLAVLAALRARGIKPDFVVGHSVGEFAALAAASSIGVKETIALVRERGVWPANYNCPGQLVVSGESDAVDECCSLAEEAGARRTVKLRVSGAFHSPLVARAAERLRPAIDRVRFIEPVAPFMSTVTARIESAPRIAPLLVDQLTAPVRFTQAASELIRGGARTFVEVGPGNVLSGLVKRIDKSIEARAIGAPADLDAALAEWA